jgi:hypothetical protein
LNCEQGTVVVANELNSTHQVHVVIQDGGKFKLVGLKLNQEYMLRTLKKGVMTELGVIKTGSTQLDTPPV